MLKIIMKIMDLLKIENIKLNYQMILIGKIIFL
jgi:hypothetical protein